MKPYKTKQFWIVAVLTLLGLLGASGLVLDDSIAKVIGWVVSMFGALGFRGWLPSPTDTTSAPSDS